MHTLPHDATCPLPATVLAFVLLGALGLGGWKVAALVETVPGTPIPTEALRSTHSAQPAPPPKSTDIARTQVTPPQAGPTWSELTTPQKEALYPLAEHWAQLSENQKRHWLHLAVNFKSLSSWEQAKMVARITDWASLSTQQRNQARLNYAAAAQLPAERKIAQWEAYQALSPEEKMSLAARAAPKPAGAATSLHPISPKKLAKVPAAAAVKTSPANLPKIPPLTDFHANQALPVAPPEISAMVETTPVAASVAVPAPLPPMDASVPANPAPASHETTPMHPPQ